VRGGSTHGKTRFLGIRDASNKSEFRELTTRPKESPFKTGLRKGVLMRKKAVSRGKRSLRSRTRNYSDISAVGGEGHGLEKSRMRKNYGDKYREPSEGEKKLVLKNGTFKIDARRIETRLLKLIIGGKVGHP